MEYIDLSHWEIVRFDEQKGAFNNCSGKTSPITVFNFVHLRQLKPLILI